MFYCALGTIGSSKQGYLWPGTVNFSSIYPDTTLITARYRCQQPLILSGMMATYNALTIGTVVITVCKNSTTGATLSNPTTFTVTLTPLSNVQSYYNSSVDFAAGDYINLHINASTVGTTLHDLTIQLDLF